jgi:hypothetical protein
MYIYSLKIIGNLTKHFPFFSELDKPTVRLVMSGRRSLMCIICAHPLPHRIQWWWNTRKGRDDDIHQTNINQSCIAQQFIFALVLINQLYEHCQKMMRLILIFAFFF